MLLFGRYRLGPAPALQGKQVVQLLLKPRIGLLELRFVLLAEIVDHPLQSLFGFLELDLDLGFEHRGVGSAAEIAGEPQAGETPDRPLRGIELPDLDAVAIVERKAVVVVVVALAE